jgi:hypothetical protein
MSRVRRLIASSAAAAAVITTLLTGPAAIAVPTHQATPSGPLRISETFLDPTCRASGPECPAQWSDSKWDHQFADAAAAGLRTITLQDTVVRTNGSTAAVSSDVVTKTLQHARAHGMHVRLGLFRDDAQWFGASSPARDDATITERTADELWRRYGSYADVISGWYLPGEVNTNFATPARATALASYYRAVVGYLHTHDGRRPIDVAPYWNPDAGSTPAAWGTMWTTALRAAPIDRIELQDGAGDRTLSITAPATYRAQVASWYATTRSAIVRAGRATQLWTNVDLYRPGTGAPAPISEISRNVGDAEPYVSGATSFSWFNQVASWTLGTNAYQEPFAAWNRSR